MDIRNLGVFANIKAVWNAYPDGGREGDYLFIGDDETTGTKYRWNKYALLWENAAVVTETTGRQSAEFSDLNVQNEQKIGGNSEIWGDLKVHGCIEATSVDQPFAGLYPTLEALQAAYSSPKVGWWAVVGNTIPGDIYRCDVEGIWSATGEQGGDVGMAVITPNEMDAVLS